VSRGIPAQPTCAYYLYAYTRAHAISNNRVSRISGEIFIIAGGDTKGDGGCEFEIIRPGSNENDDFYNLCTRKNCM